MLQDDWYQEKRKAWGSAPVQPQDDWSASQQRLEEDEVAYDRYLDLTRVDNAKVQNELRSWEIFCNSANNKHKGGE